MSKLTDQAYAHIHHLILMGHLVSGDIITEAAIAEHLGMSRTPVGEAIRQLAREGLVDQIPRKGAVLRHVGRAELIDLFDMRQAVETFAAGKVAELATPRQIEKLEALTSAMKQIGEDAREKWQLVLSGEPMQQLFSADMTFHMLILHATGNPRLQRAVAETRMVFSVFRLQRPQLDLRVVDEAHEDHDGVISALKNRDPEKARIVMENHISQSKRYVLQELDRETSQHRAPDMLPSDLPSELLKELERIDREE